MLKLRPYQEDALTDLYHYWETEQGRKPIVSLPTGAGKSLLIAEFCRRVCVENHDVRIMVITHSRELIAQNAAELKSYWPEADIGVYSAGLKSREMESQILFVGIQSVYNKVFDFPKIDIVIADECHLIPRSVDTRYGTFFSNMHISNPDYCAFGTTATPFRLDSGLLTEGKGALFDGIAHCTDLKTLIEGKYLVPAISKGGCNEIDLKDVHTIAGEYNQGELARSADDPVLVKKAVEEIVRLGVERKAWLVYASGVTHALHIAEEMRLNGINCKVVTGDTPSEERDAILEAFRSGTLRCLVNVMVLTTGFNAPRTDLIALLMATQSTGKYVQIVGRGLRTYPGKEDCLVLDFGGNVIRHGPLDSIDPIKRKNVFCMEPTKPPMKKCPKCGLILHARVMVCPNANCMYEFPVVASHGCEAYEGAMLTSQQKSFIVKVEDFYCARHKKIGSPDSIRMEFVGPLEKVFNQWVCLDHTGFAREKALAVVKQFGGQAKTVDTALKEWHLWKKPDVITVVPEGKFFKITGVSFKPGHSVQAGLVD
jgi:DNA repair protein RadD